MAKHQARESEHEQVPALRDHDMPPMVQMIDEWERELRELAPSKQDQQYGIVQEHLRKVGVRIATRVAATMQNICAHCGKPLPMRGPVDTIPRPAPHTTLGWINQFACSRACADELRGAQHQREMDRLADLNG